MINNTSKGEILIYKTKDGLPDLAIKLEKDTIWLTQAQIAVLFGVDRSVVAKHLSNIFSEGELSENSVCAKIAHTAADGKSYKTAFYNLDAVISVGYRVNSKRATQFRIWATNVLRKYLVQGYVVNNQRLHELGLNELEQTIKLLKQSISSQQLKIDEAQGLLKVITDYANTWIILQRYDEQQLKTINQGKVVHNLKYDFSKTEIEVLKTNLIKANQATDIFGREREHSLMGIINNLEQTFDGKSLYPSIEERAANLLYFIIKDHPFTDGNKRIGSYLFILFLVKNNYLANQNGEKKLNDNALAALALLIAGSDPKEKQIMVALITNLLI